ncbi:MAG: bifunctional indole-3-glycerol phosphate synthase/phosphoribosylanthranilate isomerase [Treponema sp.]|nr:bifunctional indole-3-glycerol phosphate synthase/phosphoribosylanthranilate isomerase [Treponema sp.]
MAKDILKEIVDRRLADIERLGLDFGCGVPAVRARKVHPFIEKKGAILEIKRASPSKGDIAPSLDAAKTAVDYAKSGARAISCLTEMNYFKGSLYDFMKAVAALDKLEAKGEEIPALLRKDFLLSVDEVEVSFRAGADAVLLIARILTAETMCQMANKAEELGISVLIEVRKNEDLEKLSYVMERVNHKNIVCGVNSRDLKDFSIDMLAPCALLSKIKRIAADARVTFESGILSPDSAAFAASAGFSAILLGEAAAKNPEQAGRFVKAFCETAENKAGKSWCDYAEKVRRREAGARPLVKICGITRKEDALLAAQLGADFLGFIFWKGSKRNVESEKAFEIIKAVRAGGFKCGFVGVIVNPEDDEAKAAFSLVREGILDKIQFHSCKVPSPSDEAFADIPRYGAVNIRSEEDLSKLDDLILHGQPRVLIDAQSGNAIGGTGVTIDKALVEEAAKRARLWLAGGITAENVCNIIEDFQPELIDVASGVEAALGIKDAEKLRAFFDKVNKLEGK